MVIYINSQCSFQKYHLNIHPGIQVECLHKVVKHDIILSMENNEQQKEKAKKPQNHQTDEVTAEEAQKQREAIEKAIAQCTELMEKMNPDSNTEKRIYYKYEEIKRKFNERFKQPYSKNDFMSAMRDLSAARNIAEQKVLAKLELTMLGFSELEARYILLRKRAVGLQKDCSMNPYQEVVDFFKKAKKFGLSITVATYCFEKIVDTDENIFANVQKIQKAGFTDRDTIAIYNDCFIKKSPERIDFEALAILYKKGLSRERAVQLIKYFGEKEEIKGRLSAFLSFMADVSGGTEPENTVLLWRIFDGNATKAAAYDKKKITSIYSASKNRNIFPLIDELKNEGCSDEELIEALKGWTAGINFDNQDFMAEVVSIISFKHQYPDLFKKFGNTDMRDIAKYYFYKGTRQRKAIVADFLNQPDSENMNNIFESPKIQYMERIYEAGVNDFAKASALADYFYFHGVKDMPNKKKLEEEYSAIEEEKKSFRLFLEKTMEVDTVRETIGMIADKSLKESMSSVISEQIAECQAFLLYVVRNNIITSSKSLRTFLRDPSLPFSIQAYVIMGKKNEDENIALALRVGASLYHDGISGMISKGMVEQKIIELEKMEKDLGKIYLFKGRNVVIAQAIHKTIFGDDILGNDIRNDSEKSAEKGSVAYEMPENHTLKELERVKEGILNRIRNTPPPMTFYFRGHGSSGTMFLYANSPLSRAIGLELYEPKGKEDEYSKAKKISAKEFADAIISRREKFPNSADELAHDIYLTMGCNGQTFLRNVTRMIKEGGGIHPIMISTTEYGSLNIDRKVFGKDKSIYGVGETNITLRDILRRSKKWWGISGFFLQAPNDKKAPQRVGKNEEKGKMAG